MLFLCYNSDKLVACYSILYALPSRFVFILPLLSVCLSFFLSFFLSLAVVVAAAAAAAAAAICVVIIVCIFLCVCVGAISAVVFDWCLRGNCRRNLATPNV